MHWKSTVNKKEYLFTHWNFFLFRYENNIHVYKIEAQIQSKKRIKIKKTISLKLIFFLSLLNIFSHKLSHDDPINWSVIDV